MVDEMHLLLQLLLCISSTIGQYREYGQFSNQILQTAVSCDDRQLYFRIHFERPFHGLIYTENGFPNCVYVNGSIEARHSYDMEIPLFGCLTRQQPNRDYENTVVVQQNRHYLKSTDRKYLLTCISEIGGNQDGSFTAKFGGVTVKNSLPSAEVVKGNDSLDENGQLDYSVQILHGRGVHLCHRTVHLHHRTDPTGLPVLGSLEVGDYIVYVVRIAHLHTASDARIGRCWAQDGRDGSKLQLADDRGCSVQTNGQVWGEFQSTITDDRTDERTFYNAIKAWAFPTSYRVDIFCNLHVCVKRCKTTDCRRRTRRVVIWKLDGQESVIKTIEAHLQVVASNIKSEDTLSRPKLITLSTRSTSNESVGYLCAGRNHLVIGATFILLTVGFSLAALGFTIYKLHFSRTYQ